MAQQEEDETQKYGSLSRSSSSSSSSKKRKYKNRQKEVAIKNRQRGAGIAELEEMRKEEEEEEEQNKQLALVDSQGFSGHKITPKFNVPMDGSAAVDHGMLSRNTTADSVWRPWEPSSSLVNVSTRSLNMQIEPPSSQSFRSNYTFLRSWATEGEKMVRLKMDPISVDDPRGVTNKYKVPKLVHPSRESKESTHSGLGSTSSQEPQSHVTREGSLSLSRKSSSEQSINHNFPSFPPPETVPMTYFTNPPNIRATTMDLYFRQARTASNQLQALHSSKAPPQEQGFQQPTTINSQNGTEEEKELDLELKL